MKINNIKNEDLVYFGERIEPYFASSIIIRGMLNKKNLAKVLSWENGARWMYANNYFFLEKTDLNKVQSIIKNRVSGRDGGTYVKKLIKKCFEYGDRLINTSKNIKQQAETANLKKEEISDLLNKYTTEAGNYMIFQNIALFEDAISDLAYQIAKKYSTNENQLSSLLDLITTVNRLTGGEKEQDDFLRLCAFKENKRLAEKHAEIYGWLAIRFFVGEPWSKEAVFKRIKNYSPAKAKTELNKRINARKKKERQIEKAIQCFSLKDKETVELIRDVVFLRTQRTDFFQESSYYVLPLVKKAAAQLNISYDDLLYLSAPELLLSLGGEFDYSACIEKRKKGFLVFFGHKKDIVLDSNDAIKYIKQRPILNQGQVNAKKITGKTGFKGKIAGMVKIIKSDKDNSKVKKGDIIVAIMTTPNFIPAMEKAAAFITDEGGITCHAAIIAREMKKPCIIGTKIATKILKDGDIVEVDAGKGEIRIIK